MLYPHQKRPGNICHEQKPFSSQIDPKSGDFTEERTHLGVLKKNILKNVAMLSLDLPGTTRWLLLVYSTTHGLLY